MLAFSENDRPLVLNKTNATTLAEIYGPETGEWEGKAIKLVPSPHHFREDGEVHPDQPRKG